MTRRLILPFPRGSVGKTIAIECNDYETKDRIFDFLSGGIIQPRPHKEPSRTDDGERTETEDSK